MRTKLCRFGVVCFISIFVLVAHGHAGDGALSLEERLQKLQSLIEMQQQQLDRQAQELTQLKEQLSDNKQTIAAGSTENKGDDEKNVTSSISNVNLGLYGHINKGILYGDNGDDSQFYFVDNMNSQTRLGLKASIDTNYGWKVGGRIEYGIVSNGSSDVNQLDNDNATATNFKLRWAEVSFESQSFGKLSLGKGSSATDGTAEVDLSGTTVAAYSSIADLAGSFLFYDGTLSSLEIGDVNSNFDGLGRTDRLRYDTISFGGFSIAGSVSSGKGYDGSVNFSRKYGETKVAAALGVADSGDLIPGVDAVYSGSASVLFPVGFNVTVSAGYEDLADSARDNPFNWYAKLGYKTKFYEAASTAFSIDYSETTDLEENGDTAISIGLAAVHNVTDWGTELYIVYRLHQLETALTDYNDIHAVMTGARVKF